MTIEKLLDRIIGYSLLYVQTGDPKHYALVEDARAEINLRAAEPSSEVSVMKKRYGRPTVILWNGDRWTVNSESMFRGGTGRGKNRKPKTAQE